MGHISLSPEALYLQLGQLVAEMPDLRVLITPDTQKWLARAVVLVEASGDIGDVAALKAAIQFLPRNVRDNPHIIQTVVYRALMRAELAAPVAVQGTFIPAGNSLQALTAVGKALEGARLDVLFVDPYSDIKLLTDFAALLPEGVSVRILSDEQHHKPSLKPAAERWKQQYGQARPLDVRLAATALHDRLIFLDNARAWVVGQSFKDLAQKAPTSLVRVDADTAALKISAYADIWKAAEVL